MPGAPMATLLLSRRDVEELLPMGECIELMAGALAALARGEALQPLRSANWLPDRRGLLGVMPGYLAGADAGAAEPLPGDHVLGLKVVSVFPGNHALGEESHQGVVMLFDVERGRPVALLDAASVTAIRTAAASAVATRALANPEAGD